MTPNVENVTDLAKARARKVPKIIVVEACRADDVSMMEEATGIATLPGSRNTLQEVLDHGVFLSIRKNAENVLSYVLGQGGPVPNRSDICGEGDPSIGILEILVAHGWDINARPHGSRPFLWQVLSNHDLVAWGLDHGASVQPKDQEPYEDGECLRNHTDCPPVLEQAVRYCCRVSTFDLLRSRGAPMTRRVLHLAAETAAETCSEQQLMLVRHLLDEYTLDVNAPDAAHSGMGNHYGTPLCYVACKGQAGCKSITELLLERGADPALTIQPAGYSAMDWAKQLKNDRFLEVIESWRKKNVAT